MFRFRKRVLLPEPPAGHGDFWVVVHVKLAQPIHDVDDPAETPAQGYYRNFGVRATPDRIPDVLQGAVGDGRIVWDDTEWHPVDLASLERDIRKRIEPLASEGIWYRSGRILYADPDLEPEPS